MKNAEGARDKTTTSAATTTSSSPRESSAPEQRAHARTVLEVEVSFETESHFFAGLTRDISEGGLFLATYRPLAVGARVSLSLSLPDGALEVTGTVRWSRDANEGSAPGVGIAFDPLDETATKRINRFCELRAPLYYDVDDA
jgi:uncharacterized protein (TIGR02266 family)